MIEHLLALAASMGPAIGNHLWQSTLFAGTAALMALLLRGNQAKVRYGLWLAASVKFLIPFSLLVWFGGAFHKASPVSNEPQMAMYTLIDAASQPFDEMRLITKPRHSKVWREPVATLLSGVLAAVWACGVVLVVLMWFGRWRQVSAMLRKASLTKQGREVEMLRRLESDLQMRKGIAFVQSHGMMEPGILGIFRPILLWPERLSERLNDEHIQAILAHELMHVRRHDNLSAAMHMVVEAAFWFHPVVWWIESRMLDERERAIDEEVVQMMGRPDVYAESLLNACRFCLESPFVCVSGVAGADLRKRVAGIMSEPRATRLSLVRKTLLAAAAVLVFLGPLGFGLLQAMQANAPLLHATNSPPPSFEVATIKPSKDLKFSPGVNIQLSPARFAAHSSLKGLIKFAYQVKSDDQIVGGPGWMSSESFDIQAKASETEIEAFNKLPFPKNIEEIKLLIQSLLADRFQLKVSFRTEDLPVYALVVTKDGPKLKEVEPSPFPPPGTSAPPGSHVPRLGKSAPNQTTAIAMPMREVADWLSRFDEVGNRVVVDETGLKGNYDWVLNGVSPASSNDPSVTSIFTALQEQLGLKLVSQKAPVEVLVIDHVERPSEN
jgi:bla regulator protein BlaR1